MAQIIPFFELFHSLQLDYDLRVQMDGAYLTAAELEKERRRMSLALTVREDLKDGKEKLASAVEKAYDLQEVLIRQTVEAPKQTAGKKKNEAGEIYMGSSIRGSVRPMEGLDSETGNMIIVAGKVFATDFRETRKGGFLLTFDMTDFQTSVHVVKFLKKEDKSLLKQNIKSGMWLKVQGTIKPSRDGSDIELEPKNICTYPHEIRQDTAPVKRVELHAHTTFSNMDALSSLNPKAGPEGNLVKRAEAWGHPAIAITDHGVVQGFPDAWHSAKNIKLLYGMEGYYLNNLDDSLAVYGSKDFHFTDEFVAVDLETTGTSVKLDAITEIGAVVIKDGKVEKRFQTFVDPGRHLSQEIISKTNITDAMLEGAPKPKEALTAFLQFAGERPLAAHNAEFDIGFIRENCRKEGLDFDPTYVDTLVLAQNLLPQLNKHKLDTVAEYLRLPPFQHHRAEDDAETCGLFLPFFFQKLAEELDVHSIQAINPVMPQLRKKGTANRKPKHIILLAKNKTGLKNLYQLVSLSNLKYFKRFPIIPKDELIAHREGLIIGAACEAGEVFQAVMRHKDWTELKRIADFYDYLEIQPLCNNAFHIREGHVKDEEELRELNRTVVRLGEELGKPVCATGDVHFLDPEDEIYRHILLDSKKFADCDFPLPIYFRTTDEMLEEFSYLGEEKAMEVVVTNTTAIADMVETFDLLPKGKLFPPRLENSEQELNQLVWDKVHELYGEEPPQLIVDRLNVELGGILGKYDVVYMSAQKLVQRSLENGYLVGSRGSVGSSLAAYMSGITEVNALPPHYRCPKCRNSEFITDGSFGCGADMPDKDCPVCGTKYVKDGFDIPFETFLGFGGGKVPDIDLNFSGEYQARAHRHAIEMFGETQVFRAGTIGTVAEKTAYGYVKKYLEARGLNPGHAEENRLTQGCVGVKRTTGQHPGGLVVVPDDLDVEDFCPVQHPADAANSDIITTHFEYHCMEDNLLKLDMLGHDDPSMVRMMEDLTGLNARTIPLDDADTMSLFTTSKALGFENDKILGPTGAVAIPEFNTKFTRQMLVDTQPKDFNTLVRLSGFSHGTDVWLGNAKDLILDGTASVTETVGCRDDIMLYLISKGLDPKMSFKIMESVRKGKVKAGGFEEGWEAAMREHNVPDWYIQSLTKIGYLFPKAHAVAYVMMAFRIAWFKVHKPLAFYAAFFSIRAKAFDAEYCCAGLDAVKKKLLSIWDNKNAAAVEQDLAVTLEVCYEFYLRGFRFETINIYESEATKFVIKGNALIPPFTAVRGLGETAAVDTVASRKGKEFVSVEEFSLCCNKLSKAHIEQLKKLGAFAGLADTSQITLF
ncbi:MAG: PolC-type DNA polymerase III [Oscillospiraceae bacterium]|nr:PolC-type DNA polymerase III [Oscillospiraceae bacterium]